MCDTCIHNFRKHPELIISVLTAAAHCIRSKGSSKPLDVGKIKVLLGAYGILDKIITDECFKKDHHGSRVSNVIIHDGWSSAKDSNFTHDIALLKLKDKIEEFTPTIYPICLKKSKEISNIKKGSAGFGKFPGDVHREVVLSIVNNTELVNCDSKKSIQAAWNESFVVKSEMAEGFPVDIGSGFFVESDEKFYLRGLLSVDNNIYYEEGTSCTNFSIYTDVLEYLDDFILKVSDKTNSF